MFNEPTFGIQKPVAVAVDVGYALPKYTFMRDGEVSTGSFPSISVRAPQTALTADQELPVSNLTFNDDRSATHV
jgi:hypothetical protein